MNKKRRKILKKIRQEKVRLEKDLETFLASLPEKKGYEPYVKLLTALRLWKTEDEPMEMDYSIITDIDTSICAQLDTNRKIAVGISLLYAFIINDILDNRIIKDLPDKMDNFFHEISEFKNLLKSFLFL